MNKSREQLFLQSWTCRGINVGKITSPINFYEFFQWDLVICVLASPQLFFLCFDEQ